MINPANIPTIPGNMAVLDQHAGTITSVGADFAATGAKVHSTWQALAPVYEAPESGQLFAATGPVQSVSASVGEDLGAVGGVLKTYSTEVAAIKARLELLRTQAFDFVAAANADEDWRSDQAKVDRHNELLSDVNAAWADYMDAQRRCANAILARYTGERYTTENGDGTVTATEFGYTKDVLDAALAQDGGLPWGSPEQHDRGFFGDVGAFFVGVKDGGVGFVKGLGALIGYGEDGWSWSNAGTAWKGLGLFAMSLSLPLTALNEFTALPGIPKGTLSNTLIGAGKGLIAYDTWKTDKSKAAGEATFNIVSAIVGTKGAGAGLRGAGAAAEASRFATVAKVGAGAVKAGEFIVKLPKVSDVVLGTIKKFPGFKLPHLDLPHTDIPTTHIDSPHIETPAGHAPSGASVGDGVRPHPPAATITPHGVVDGRPFQHTPDVPASPVHNGVIGAHPHVDAPTPHGADAPASPHRAEPLPPGATITDKGIVPGHHVGATPTGGGGVHIGPDGVIRAGSDVPVTPHGADVTPAPHGGDVTPTPHGSDATPTPHGSDAAQAPAQHGSETVGSNAPAHDAKPLPPGATLSDRGVVPAPHGVEAPGSTPGTHGHSPVADAGPGIHIDRDGVIRPGAHPDAPTPHEPALVGAHERPVVQDGVIGGRHGLDHTPPALHGEPGHPGGLHTDPPGGRLPDEPGGGRLPHDPAPHDPGAHDAAGHDGAAHADDTPSPGTDHPHDPAAGHDPGTGDAVAAPTHPLPPGVHPPLHRATPLPTEDLKGFHGENDPSMPNAPFGGRVEYYTPEMLEHQRVVVIDGKLHWAHDGSLLDTRQADIIFDHGGQTPRAIFVMDRNGNLYVSLEQELGRIHHSSLLAGKPVSGAGEISAVNGVPEFISRKSGHYRPTEATLEIVRDALGEQGLDVSGVDYGAGF